MGHLCIVMWSSLYCTMETDRVLVQYLSAQLFDAVVYICAVCTCDASQGQCLL